MTDILAGKDESDIEVRSLKHGWTSVREKLQQQMAAQQQQVAENMAAVVAQQHAAVALSAHQMAAANNTTTPTDMSPLVGGGACHPYPMTNGYSACGSASGTEYFGFDSNHIAATNMMY